MLIMTKVIYLLSIVAHVMGNSVGRWSTCPSCDIGDRSQDLQWSPVPNMALCMYGYDPFEMDRFTEGKPDPGVKKKIFEPTKYSTERNAMVLNDFVSYADDINCNVAHLVLMLGSSGVMNNSLRSCHDYCFIITFQFDTDIGRAMHTLNVLFFN